MSDDGRSRSPSPLRLHPTTRGDPALFGHLGRLKDAVCGGQITSDTTLVALHRPRSSLHNEKTLLESFTGIAEPKVRCQINGDGDLESWYPKTLTDEHDGASVILRATFNKLMLAPVIRLEASFRQSSSLATPKLPTLVLEFHMNLNDQVEVIKDLRFEDDGRITFTTTGSTCSGFNLLPEAEAHLLPEQRDFVQMLLRLRDPISSRAVVIRLDLDSLSNERRLMHQQILHRLTGTFANRLLPTQREYSVFRREADGKLSFKHRETQSMKDLIGGPACHPMVALDCTNTFSTVLEAQIQLAYSAVVMDAESRAALLLWAEGQGGGFLYNHDEFPVLAVKRSRDSLPGSTGSTKLPNELECRIDIYYEKKVESRIETKTATILGHLLDSNPGVPHNDAYFRLAMSKALCGDIINYYKFFKDAWIKAKLTPHINSFTFSSQLETCQQLGEPRNARWQTLLLNQRHEKSELVDVTATAKIEPSLREKANAWLKTCKPWNKEQMQVVDGTLSQIKAGMSVVMGPAGTGKTTLHIALTLYFWILGFHVLSLAPANSNCNHVAANINSEQLQTEFPGFERFGFVDTDVVRLFPGHRDVEVKKMTDTQAKSKKVGHKDRRVLSLNELAFALEQEKSGCTTAQSRGVVHTVIKLADDGFSGYPSVSSEGTPPAEHEADEMSEIGDTLTRNCVLNEHYADRWDRLREYIEWLRTGKVCKEMRRLYKAEQEGKKAGRTTADRTRSYLMAYEACVVEVLGHNRFLITTTGNVRSSEMMQWWGLYGDAPSVVVFCDEAAKDVEVNVWSAIVCERWASRVRGVYLFGDDRQLKPTNTCIQNYDHKTKVHTQYNSYFDRLDISLPCRLVAEGFPFIRLKEQRRMNKNLSDFPNRKVYGGELRDGPGMDQSLEDVKPGLLAALTDIIAGGGEMSAPAQESYLAEASEEKARLHWIEVESPKHWRDLSTSKSIKVETHILVFFSKIYPKLLAYFKSKNEKVVDNCMLVCAYGYTLQAYQERFTKWLVEHPESTADDQPRLLTVDAAQGQEATMVIFDSGLQWGSRLGFLGDSRRINVALTRAKEISWVIGGDMAMEYGRDEKRMINEYHDELKAAGKVHKFTV